MARPKVSSGMILLFIVGLVVLAVLLSPAESDTGGPGSTYSAGPSGVRLAFDLSRRLGWASEKREVSFTADTMPARVQMLVGVRPGAEEAHALLEHVRHGGSLLVAGTDGVLGDSLYVASGSKGFPASDVAEECPSGDPLENVLRGSHMIAPVRWRRPPPRDTVGFGQLDRGRRGVRPAVGFPLGAGRVVVVADEDFVTNDLMRLCSTEADVAYVRMLEYLTKGQKETRIAFDEFHHGRGVHGGSLSAIELYVMTTPSGRTLGQIAVAGLLLLIAAAPRPLAPRDPTRVARRSPLEHADALAHAYAAVGATRTATSRLLAGVRRRARSNRSGARESDDQILATASAMSPSAGPAASLVARALTEPMPARELPTIAGALSAVEHALTARPSIRNS
jgi:hypothetical protein